MNRTLVDRIANAVLYEGYILYPYRPSLKNRQRWTFGGLLPPEWCQSHATGDVASLQTMCLVRGDQTTVLEVLVRFLHVTNRIVGTVDEAGVEHEDGLSFRPVEELRVAGRVYHPWQEAEEREVDCGIIRLSGLAGKPCTISFAFPASRRMESVRGSTEEPVAVLVREQCEVQGVVLLSAVEVDDGLFQLTVRVENCTENERSFAMAQLSRAEALRRALISTHTILGIRKGEFISLMDPPECCRAAVAACNNVGTWPVLVGNDGDKDRMLSSPIILSDYPEVAPESPGDYFDGTEMDEMLTLRILTMTDDEKQAMAGSDERTAALLARTENLGPEQLHDLHGIMRGLRTIE